MGVTAVWEGGINRGIVRLPLSIYLFTLLLFFRWRASTRMMCVWFSVPGNVRVIVMSAITHAGAGGDGGGGGDRKERP